MPHFFLVLSVNGSGPYSLGGGNDSVKLGIFGNGFSSVRRVTGSGVSSAGAIPSG